MKEEQTMAEVSALSKQFPTTIFLMVLCNKPSDAIMLAIAGSERRGALASWCQELLLVQATAVA